MRIEDQIISNLIFTDDFARKVIPFTKPEYFSERNDLIVVDEIIKFFNQYNKHITKEILEIEVLGRKDLTQKEAKELPSYIQAIEGKDTNLEWLVTETEKFYQKRAVYLAILDSIQIIDGKDSKRSEDAIPSLLQDALSVTFDTQIGHDYIDDSESRYDFYHRKEEGIRFDIDLLNEITGDVGLRPKTLTCVAARTGGGKSIFLCHVAASTLMQGNNVLFVSMEMSEERIAERIDANLFNTPIPNLRSLDKEQFNTRISKVRNKTHGKLVIKEYPTGSAHAGHFRALIEDLRTKKNFVPDMIIVDYMNICSSQRIRNNQANSYTIVKSISEELRSLAIEYNVPVVTATQLNRGGVDNSDVGMTDTSESFGAVMTFDLYLALIRTEELDALGQILVKQLKNRYADPSKHNKFVVGLDTTRMKFYNVESSAQNNISGNDDDDDIPVFDTSKFGKRLKTEGFKF